MSEPTPAIQVGDRLAKVMARSGLCSRRDAEEWIRAGRVTVNGRKILTPAFNVGASDQVVVDGTPLAARAGTRVWLYHKPRGLVVTEKDPEGRPTVFDTLAREGLPRVVSVGRLDINTEGLLLLTNDGGLKRVLELPATGWLRKYRVRAHGTITQEQLDRLKAGIEVDGIKYGPMEATLERDQGANVWLELALREGKNREVKNVLGALGLEVNRLIRISFGPFMLGDLPVGGIEVVKARVLKDQLGKKLADKAEADFDSEMPERTAPDTPRPSRASGRKPGRTEERTFGRGTHTTTIEQHRFRFTDRAELTPEQAAERRAARPRQDRPGANSGSRRPAPRARIEEDTGPVRQIHFDDGREPTVFEEKTYGKKPKFGDAKGGDRKPGAFGARGKADGPRSGGPRGASAGSKPQSFGDKPRRPRAEGDAARPARAVKTRAEGGAARPARAFKPRAEGDTARPARSYKPRGEGAAPRAPRADGDGPRAPRAFGGKSRGAAGTDALPARPFKPRAAADAPGAATRIARKPGGGKPGASDRPREPRPAGGRPASRPVGAGRPSGKDGPPRRPTRPPREK